jgi:hypothetical protein
MVRPVKGWDEQDALTGWRTVYTSMQRPGATSQVKRRYRRRERRQGKDSIRRGLD